MNTTLKIILVSSLIGVAVLIVAFVADDDTPDELNYRETQPVIRKDVETSVLATGIIKPQVGAEVRIGSRASGTVTDLFVRIGDKVEKGQMLAKLDDSELQAQLRKNQTLVNDAELDLKYTSIEYERARNLSQKEYISQQALDNTRKTFEQAKINLEREKANLEYTSIQLGYTKIYASISGVISSVTTQEGETVAALMSSPTFVTIINLDRLEVQTYVDETDIGYIQTGQEASFTVDTYHDFTFNGKVTAIYPQAEIQNNVVNYIVIVQIEIPETKILRPEMTASVTIYVDRRENVLSIPNNAITENTDGNIVTVLKDRVPESRNVKTGLRGKYHTEIIEGLQENELVVIK